MIFQSKKVTSVPRPEGIVKTVNKTPNRTTQGPHETAWSEGGHTRFDAVSGSQDVKVKRTTHVPVAKVK